MKIHVLDHFKTVSKANAAKAFIQAPELGRRTHTCVHHDKFPAKGGCTMEPKLEQCPCSTCSPLCSHGSILLPNGGKRQEENHDRREECKKGSGHRTGVRLQWGAQSEYDPVGVVFKYTLSLVLRLH